MLYISRLFHDGSYGVVDTDDWHETVVTMKQLEYCIFSFHLDIKGVVLSGNKADILDAVPYMGQPPTRKQTKLKLLSGVEIYTFGRIITRISYKYFPDVGVPRIRLSDYGDECADFLIHVEEGHEHAVTLVLDDKLKFSPYTFRMPKTTIGLLLGGGPGVGYDVRELRNEEKVKAIYASVLAYYGSVKYIFDDEERRDRVYKLLLEV